MYVCVTSKLSLATSINFQRRMPCKSVQPEFLVNILMCTYNGAHYLKEQLDSLHHQSHKNWKLIVSDDGSEDATLDILAKFKDAHAPGRVKVIRGPQRGFAANFLSLALSDDLDGSYFAFCDQDDIWRPNKLERALEVLSCISADRPAAYGCRTELIAENGRHIGFSPSLRRPPSFLNALTQSIAGGNTTVFNLRTLQLLRLAGPVEIISHDWWVYLLVTGTGGEFSFDAEPLVLYRQHRNNLVGANSSMFGQFSRAKAMFNGRYRNWMNINIFALEGVQDVLTENNQAVLRQFQYARSSNLLRRLPLLFRSGARRQSFLGNCGLAVAFLLKRA